jgi:S-adenosylmethionine hydrolase
MIAILSDFNHSGYLGQMKGSILSKNWEAKLVDLSHAIKPQNVREGAWVLKQSFSFFPKGTIFLCVVDPGVGGKRKAIAVRTKNYLFVGPDNGLMFEALKADGLKEAVSLPLKGASKTFHGRDVFAKAAAELEKGTALAKLGKKISKGKLKKLSFKFNTKKKEGEIVLLDGFGNVVTNIPVKGKKKSYRLILHDFDEELKFYETYEQAGEEEMFLLKGSANTFEVSIKGESAAKKLNPVLGESIQIK